MKKAFKVLLIVLAALILLAGSYVAYVLLSSHRIGDQSLAVQGPEPSAAPEKGREYTVVSYNIGFGAYETDYSFFLDGGTQSWAWSKERLDANLRRIGEVLRAQEAPFLLVQEVDFDSTRSYHVDERTYLTEALPDLAWDFAQNYDSPFLCYPFRQPHGASRAGLMTFSAFAVASAERRELPIETGFMRFLDLDRCYAKSRIPLAGGGELVLYNVHLSAYTSDGAIATEQLRLLLEDMEGEFGRGNWCVAGGDFNKDLLGDSAAVFGWGESSATWAQPIPEDAFDGFHISLAAPLDPLDPVPSCRNADAPYHPGQMVLTVDGFLVSDNVRVLESRVIDTGFACSDHNPASMRFLLLPATQDPQG